mmetsp:Transcript_88445/g.222612  ORF Transcript_88445/g.222612 Transcript_88445/m.222612 type:complete len:202 (-) Transcript_88445:1199-1804(-)
MSSRPACTFVTTRPTAPSSKKATAASTSSSSARVWPRSCRTPTPSTRRETRLGQWPSSSTPGPRLGSWPCCTIARGRPRSSRQGPARSGCWTSRGGGTCCRRCPRRGSRSTSACSTLSPSSLSTSRRPKSAMPSRTASRRCTTRTARPSSPRERSATPSTSSWMAVAAPPCRASGRVRLRRATTSERARSSGARPTRRRSS